MIDAPSTRERYSTVLSSHNNHVSTKRHSPADLIWAAGITAKVSPSHELGCSLIRLQAEVDCALGIRSWSGVRSFASAQTQTAALLLKGIKNHHVKVADESVIPLARAVLHTFLDTMCPFCEGLGFVGVIYNGEKQTPCRACRATGTKWHSIGKDEPQRDLATWARGEMIMAIDRAMSHVKWISGSRS